MYIYIYICSVYVCICEFQNLSIYLYIYFISIQKYPIYIPLILGSAHIFPRLHRLQGSKFGPGDLHHLGGTFLMEMERPGVNQEDPGNKNTGKMRNSSNDPQLFQDYSDIPSGSTDTFEFKKYVYVAYLF